MKTATVMIGSGYYLEDLQILQNAIDKKGKLPKEYFDTQWSEENQTKAEVREIRLNLINEIIEIINSQNNLPYKDKMPVDHYARYLHALTILKVDKDVLHKTKNDYIRNAMLELWVLDDGSEESWKMIDSVAWFISESIKGIQGDVVAETLYPEE